jgi:hypothetical protein
MAVVLVGLVGWPLMSATVSAEGTDAWEAVSRSYSYVYQAPWHFIWYSFVALVYGAIIVFFVGFMGSLSVYLAKWGVGQTPFVESANRDPSYLFVWAPKSFGWRELLLQGAQVKVTEEVQTKDGKTETITREKTLIVNRPLKDKDTEISYDDYLKEFRWYNYIGAAFGLIWMLLVFLLVLGFGYSYFWTAGSIIYLLMRKKVDDAELDEVYLEEEEQEPLYREPPPSGAPAPAEGTGPAVQQIGLSSLRPAPQPEPVPPAAPGEPAPAGPGTTPAHEGSGAEPPPAPTAPPPESPPTSGDGSPPAGDGSPPAGSGS